MSCPPRSCLLEFDSIYKSLYNKTCLENCPPGFFAGENYVCQPCNSECGNCTVKADFCTICTDKSMFLHRESGKCNAACEVGEYPNIEAGKCETCPLNFSIAHRVTVKTNVPLAKRIPNRSFTCSCSRAAAMTTVLRR